MINNISLPDNDLTSKIERLKYLRGWFNSLFSSEEARNTCSECSGCCCCGCKENEGYLSQDHLSRSEVDDLKIRYGFSQDTGFRGPQGCVLPRIFRSITCITYTCHTLRGALIKKEPEFPSPHLPVVDIDLVDSTRVNVEITQDDLEMYLQRYMYNISTEIRDITKELRSKGEKGNE